MNRIEYMTKLASLLQDIPEEERRDAMKYYNDYFDEAGKENEEQVVEELGSPEDVATNIKADFQDRGQENNQSGDAQNTQRSDQSQGTGNTQGTYQYGTDGTMENQSRTTESWTTRFKNMDSTTRTILIIVAIILTLPITLPVVGGVASALFGIIVTIFSVFFGLIVASVAVLVGGMVLAIIGAALLVPSTAAGLAVLGVGLVLISLGLLATVGSVKLCIIVFPALVRGIKALWKKIVPGKAVA